MQGGANPNLKTRAGESPLHLAAEMGDASIVRLLVMHDADSGVLDARGLTPLQLAIDYGHVSPELFAAFGQGPFSRATKLTIQQILES